MKCLICNKDIEKHRKFCSQDCYKKYLKQKGSWNKGMKKTEWMSVEGIKISNSNMTHRFEKGHKIRNTGKTRFKKGHQPSEEKREQSRQICIERNKTNNPVWKTEVRKKISETLKRVLPGKTKGEDLRKLMAYRDWKKEVLKRDNYTCQHCGTKEKLCCHHIKGFHTYPKKSYDLDNGLTLCGSCHSKEHWRLRKQ